MLTFNDIRVVAVLAIVAATPAVAMGQGGVQAPAPTTGTQSPAPVGAPAPAAPATGTPVASTPIPGSSGDAAQPIGTGAAPAAATPVQFDIRTLQRRLRVRGIKVPVTGQYSKVTRAGVRILQRRLHVKATGVVDARVLAALKMKARSVASAPAADPAAATPTDAVTGKTATVEQNDTTPSAAGFVWPASGEFSSPFGMRWGRMHEGVDIAAPIGTQIRAANAGTVTFAGESSGYGNLTIIDHGGGIQTAYGHQSQIDVTVGQVVTRGQPIGKVGNTGHSTGPHLHFEVRVNGAAVDPVPYL